MQQVFRNPSAAYLMSVNQGTDNIISPLNIGMENSRRFRALPVYATLMAYGRHGYVDMLERQVRLARAVAKFVNEHDKFDLLPEWLRESDRMVQEVFIIVLFKAKDTGLNRQLVQRINATSQMYVSGTVWNHEAACRIAVSNWQVDLERDLQLVQTVLNDVVRDWQKEESK